MQDFHPLLRKQWKRYMANSEAFAAGWRPLLTAVSRAYEDYDADRCLLERAIELSSHELVQANAELRAILDVLPDSLFRITAEDRLVQLSTAGSEWVKRFLSELNEVSAPSREAYSSFWATVADVRMNPRVLSYEFTIPSAEGEKSCEIRLLPFVGGDLIGLARDITNRKSAENALQRSQQALLAANVKLAATNRQLRIAEHAAQAANQAKSQFLANMSHEVRTPLNGILGLTELVLSSSLQAEQRDLLETAQSSAESLLTIVNDILDLSKMEAGKLDVEVLDVDLHQLVELCARSFAVRAWNKGVELIFEVDPSCPAVIRADPTRVRQVLFNLLSNAVKFTARGQIFLKVRGRRRAGSEVLDFAVADTGMGIPRQRHTAVFQPFSQADTSTTRIYGGTGLGLAIAQRLVELMSGDLWLKSVPGRGTVLHFTIPLLAAAPKGIEDHGLAGRRALVVAGNRTARAVLKRVMESWSMEIQTMGGIPTPTSMRSLSAGETPEMILIDCGADLDLVDCIAAAREASGCHIVLLLAAANSDIRAEGCRDLGVEWVVKPVGCRELLSLTRRLLTGGGAEAVATKPIQTPGPPIQRSLRILVAEDNPVNQKVVRKLLERKGHRAILAETGRRALELFREQPFDLILMDVQMPEMDGMAAARQIRAEERGRIPIVALTAHAMKGDAERCLAAGMDAYLPKPIRSEDLFNLIDSMVLPD